MRFFGHVLFSVIYWIRSIKDKVRESPKSALSVRKKKKKKKKIRLFVKHIFGSFKHL